MFFRDSNPAPPPQKKTSTAYGLIVLLSISSPLITYFIAIGPVGYGAKVAGVLVVSLASAVFSVFYVSRLHARAASETVSQSASEPAADDHLDLTEVERFAGQVERAAGDRDESLAASLADPVTGLANERAMVMVLENQLAESQRSRGERPLGILAAEIRNFSAINEVYGHEIGDCVLSFCGENLRLVMRKMDLAARSDNDLFIVLPATGQTAMIEALARIARHFDDLYFESEETGLIPVRLDFGWASFEEDGETAEELINAALSRKRQAKAETLIDVDELKRDYVH